jgi:murein DD-endopeptidase MepM/ murein hydrolase activator NlpD
MKLNHFIGVLSVLTLAACGSQDSNEETSIQGNAGKVFTAPLNSYRISSGYGNRSRGFHPGVDFAAPGGTPVKSISAGVKRSGSPEGACGNVVRMSHSLAGANWQSRYCHLSSFAGINGRFYSQNTTIGRVGSTGRSTGPHLHLELYRNGALQNPSGWIRL